MAAVSNQYAAMPSHAHRLVDLVRARAMPDGAPALGCKRSLSSLYPAATVFCIMVTGNHYWFDAFGGLVALGGGSLIGSTSPHPANAGSNAAPPSEPDAVATGT